MDIYRRDRRGVKHKSRINNKKHGKLPKSKHTSIKRSILENSGLGWIDYQGIDLEYNYITKQIYQNRGGGVIGGAVVDDKVDINRRNQGVYIIT